MTCGGKRLRAQHFLEAHNKYDIQSAFQKQFLK